MIGKRSFLIVLAAPLLLSLVIACGGGSKKSDSNSGDSSSQSSSQGSGDDRSSGSGSGSGSSSGSSSSNSDFDVKNCPQYSNLANIAEKAFGSSATGTGTSTKIDTKYFDDLVKNSPKEIKGDMQVFVDAMKGYIDALNKVGVDINDPNSFSKIANDQAKLAQLQTALTKLDDPKFETATNNISAYFQKKCS